MFMIIKAPIEFITKATEDNGQYMFEFWLGYLFLSTAPTYSTNKNRIFVKTILDNLGFKKRGYGRR